MIISLDENNRNPEVLNEGNIVLFISGRDKTHKKLRVGRVIYGYNNGIDYSKYPIKGMPFRVEDIIDGKIYYPYTNDVFLMDNKGIEIKSVISTIEISEELF